MLSTAFKKFLPSVGGLFWQPSTCCARRYSLIAETTSSRLPINFTKFFKSRTQSTLTSDFLEGQSSKVCDLGKKVLQSVPRGTHNTVAYWLLGCSALVASTIIVGGITRLTESGLSITEWKAMSGAAWPSSDEMWDSEFTKYRVTPEFNISNPNMTLSEFKRIYFWEWMHRNLGRTVGAAFFLPALYFTFSRPSAARVLAQGKHADFSYWMSPAMTKIAWASTLLVGFQGALGWYMVQSGLDKSFYNEGSSKPTVSAYRLTAHLGTAFILYILSVSAALRVLRVGEAEALLTYWKFEPRNFRSFARNAHMAAGLALVTALTGAVVAGLDAGLVYGTWPRMGENFAPALEEMQAPEGSTSILGAYFENPVTAQFVHRTMAYTTFAAIAALYVRGQKMPPHVRNAVSFLSGAATLQGTLGVLTLIHMVPIELAVAHQAGSINLMTAALYLMSVLGPIAKNLKK